VDDQALILDRLLVARAQAGDREAFSLLVRRWHPKLIGFCLRASGEKAAAADLAQETWVAAVKGLGRLDDPARFRAWLYRIAARKVADHIRWKTRERKGRGEMRQMAGIEGEGREGPGFEALALKAMIARLAPEKRSLLVLFYVEGLTLPELAEVFGIPAGTVKSRLHALREELKHDLKGNGHDQA
jgi:RNA polymerase sigma factor (sigma-70 family)